MRDLGVAPRSLPRALLTLEAQADRANALHARLIIARRFRLIGRLEEAAAELMRADVRGAPSVLAAVAHLAAAELALRSLRTGPARTALWVTRQSLLPAAMPPA